MKVVLDTVIFVRALINPRGRWGRLLFELNERYVIVLSPEIAKEILTVLYRPALRRRYPQIAYPDDLRRILAILEQAEIVEPKERLAVCRDVQDNKFFECAVEAKAKYIVSEDRGILAVGEFEGIRTVDAGAFIRLLSKE